MDTNTMIVWLVGIVWFIIVMLLVVKTLKIVKWVDWSVSIEVKRKVDQLQIQLEQIKSSHEEKMKEYEAKLTEIRSMVDIEKEKTIQGKDTVTKDSFIWVTQSKISSNWKNKHAENSFKDIDNSEIKF